MDLGAMMRGLIRVGFDGWYDVEILSDDGTFQDDHPDSLWREDAVRVIERACEGFLTAWGGEAICLDRSASALPL